MQLETNVEVPERLRKFLANPTPFVNQAMSEADKEALSLLKVDIAAAAPKKTGALSRSITVDTTQKKVFSPLIYARAVELGHYAEPVNRKMLHFVDKGKDVFLRFTRSRKRPYFFPTLHRDSLKIRQIYDKAFDRMAQQV